MITILATHVTIAVLSLVWTTFGYIRPTNTNLRAGYALVALTFVSGSYLVWSEPAQILHTCLSGLTYLALASVGILATRRKLATLQGEQA